MERLANGSNLQPTVAERPSRDDVDGTEVGTPFEDLGLRAAARTKIATRLPGEVLEYEFDVGDGWTHRCTLLEADVDRSRARSALEGEADVIVSGDRHLNDV